VIVENARFAVYVVDPEVATSEDVSARDVRLVAVSAAAASRGD
jgi:hypothetical protein